MRRFHVVLLALPVLVLHLGHPGSAAAQLPQRIRDNVERRVEDRIVGVADSVITCVLNDLSCIEKAKDEGKPVVLTDADGQVITDDQGHPVSDPEEAARRAEAPGEGTWRNYDFVPGKRVIRVVSMEAEPVGRFPANQLSYVRGNLQVAQVNGRNWLEASEDGIVRLELPEETGDSFSIEFHVLVPTANIGLDLYLAPVEGARSRYPYDYFSVSSRPGVYRAGNELSATNMPGIVEKVLQVKIQVDEGYVIMYVDSDRVAQVPTANIPSTRVLEFHLEGNARFHTLLDDIVVAVGVDDLYDALVNEGEFTTRGILFDLDSDRLRPESTRVLTDLADALTRAPQMRVTVEGHTDSQGEEAYNQALSERRAAAVVAWLVAHGIDAGRLSAAGKGESEPAASNDTSEGQAENRRVVVKVAG